MNLGTIKLGVDDKPRKNLTRGADESRKKLREVINLGKTKSVEVKNPGKS